MRRGAIQVMEGRHCFGHLTIEENLLTGAFTRRDGRAAIERDLERIYGYFPAPEGATRRARGLRLGRRAADVRDRPRDDGETELILLDEPSMGLAPQVVEEIFEIVRVLNEKRGVSFLLAEQNTNMALARASATSSRPGASCSTARPSALRKNEDVREFYLGVAGEGRRSFRNVKSYKRRKRWLS